VNIGCYLFSEVLGAVIEFSLACSSAVNGLGALAGTYVAGAVIDLTDLLELLVAGGVGALKYTGTELVLFFIAVFSAFILSSY
jgi:hypothetical protein